VTDRDPIKALHDDELPEAPLPPMLQMDGIRIATLITLGAHTVAVVVLWVFLATTVTQQREINECYQGMIDDVVTWANTAVTAGRSDRQAQRELLLAELNGVNGEAAVERYLDRLDEADRTRTTTPVPAQRCAR
jgi:hypothetical protein